MKIASRHQSDWFRRTFPLQDRTGGREDEEGPQCVVPRHQEGDSRAGNSDGGRVFSSLPFSFIYDSITSQKKFALTVFRSNTMSPLSTSAAFNYH